MRLRITFATAAGGDTFAQSLETALAAEAAGFASVFLSDRPHDPILEGWTLATALAARTERVRFYHATLNMPYRYPSVLAKEAATFDLISNGRLDLCLGAAGEANRPLYDSLGVPLASPKERMQDFQDYIAILRGMWSHDKFSYQGRTYHVDDVVCAPAPVQQPIPVWMGALMPYSLRVCGRIADGFIKNQRWCSADLMRDLNDQIDASATKAGRDPNVIRRVINGAGFVAKDETEAAAHQPHTLEQHGPGGLIGTPAQILDTIRAYRAAGVDTFALRFPAENTLEQIRIFGREVIPEAAKLQTRHQD